MLIDLVFDACTINHNYIRESRSLCSTLKHSHTQTHTHRQSYCTHVCGISCNTATRTSTLALAIPIAPIIRTNGAGLPAHVPFSQSGVCHDSVRLMRTNWRYSWYRTCTFGYVKHMILQILAQGGNVWRLLRSVCAYSSVEPKHEFKCAITNSVFLIWKLNKLGKQNCWPIGGMIHVKRVNWFCAMYACDMSVFLDHFTQLLASGFPKNRT